MNLQTIFQGVARLSYGECDKLTPVKMRGEAAKELIIDGFKDKIPLNTDEIEIDLSDRGIRIKLPMSAKESIYGLGLSSKTFLQNGLKKTMKACSHDHDGVGYSHAPVPFYVSSAGYGVLIDTARELQFLVDSNKMLSDKAKQESESKVGVTDEALLYKSKQSESRTNIFVDIPFAKGIDIYLFYGNSMSEAVQRYNMFCGGGALPPLWGLGVRYRSFGANNQKNTEDLSTLIRERKIPCDMLGLEPGWQSHAYSSTYKWDSNRFPNPEEMIKNVTKMGYKLDLWEQAYIDPSSPLYEKMLPFAGDFEVWGGIVPDFSIEAARKIFSDYHKKNLIDSGISSFKLDECDGDVGIGAFSNWIFPDCTKFPSGASGEQMRQMLGVMFQRTMYESFKAADRRTYGEVRASNALSAAYPFALYTDEYDFAEFVNYISSSGFIGVLWSPELRDAASYQDYCRRLSVLSFAAMFNFNNWYNKYPSWLQPDVDLNNSDVLLDDPSQYESVVIRYTNLRMSLIPYLYSAFAEYHLCGKPPVRPVVMDYCSDTAVKDINDQFMFGENILVAPLTSRNSFTKLSNMDILNIIPENCCYTKNKNNYLLNCESKKELVSGITLEFNVENPGDYIISFDAVSDTKYIATRLRYITKNGGVREFGEMWNDKQHDGYIKRTIALKEIGKYQLCVFRNISGRKKDNAVIQLSDLTVSKKEYSECNNQRFVYLPESDWYDFFTGKKYNKGMNLVTAEAEEIPVFVKDGGIVPVAKPVQYIENDTAFDITVKIFGGGESSEFTLYEDDGISYGFDRGEYNKIVIKGDKTFNKYGSFKQNRYNIKAFEYFK